MPSILIVDDSAGNVRLLEALLKSENVCVRHASNGAQALASIADERPDLILMDVMMPQIDGFEACRRIKSDPATRLIPVVLVTALQDRDSRIRGLEVGADDFLSKPFHGPELRARVRSLLRIKRFTDDLDSAESVIVSLALTIEARDPATDGHCQRLAAYATALGEALDLSDEDLWALGRGGFLHDIGKIAIPDAVLLKQGSLTPDEYTLIKQHTIIGDRLCGELRSLRRVRPIVRWHHERLDGSGYPDRLRGEEIPLLAQIIGIADVFDATTTDRPYKRAATPAQAVRELEEEAARGWRRADLVRTFANLVRTGRLPSAAADRRSAAPEWKRA